MKTIHQIIRTSCVLGFVVVTLSQPTGAVAAQAPSPPGPRPSLSATAGGPYATGLLSEEADNDLAAAAAAYREAIQEFDRQREGIANAIFRLGEVYRKMGRMEEAKVQYARVLREFPDMVQLTELSHRNLLGESLRPTRRSTGDGSAALRPAAVQPRVAPVSPPVMSTRGGFGGGTGGGMPAPEAATDEQKRMECFNNLRQLGMAAQIFANDHANAFPPELGLMRDEISRIEVLVCPADTTRSAAPSWNDFDPAENTTYDYFGAAVRATEPQQTLLRCPIHGHVVLADGSVQLGAADSTSVAPGTDEIMRRRYGLGGAGQSAGTPLAEVLEPPTASQQLRSRVIEEANLLRIRILSTQQESERIRSQLEQFAPGISHARARQAQAQERLQALAFPADRLPAVVGQDPRYQRLKAEYERAVLDGDPVNQERALNRLNTWVEQIYRPELESEAELANRRLDETVEPTREFMEKLSALQAQQTDLQGRLNAVNARLAELGVTIPEPPSR